MLLIQAVLVIFFLYAIIKVVGRFQARELALGWVILWVSFWIAAGVIVLLPNSTFYMARLVGIGRGADLVVYVALVIIFFSLFRLLLQVEKLKKEITILTRAAALEDKNKKV
ncbi:MAG: DUF2304 family protein [Candidatus Magasanikbacteria bacterium]|nr:DUF2304 family protein [Candidatus Magasanikbacteria bacterium]